MPRNLALEEVAPSPAHNSKIRPSGTPGDVPSFSLQNRPRLSLHSKPEPLKRRVEPHGGLPQKRLANLKSVSKNCHPCALSLLQCVIPRGGMRLRRPFCLLHSRSRRLLSLSYPEAARRWDSEDGMEPVKFHKGADATHLKQPPCSEPLSA
jgi:hypothetical protein